MLTRVMSKAAGGGNWPIKPTGRSSRHDRTWGKFCLGGGVHAPYASNADSASLGGDEFRAVFFFCH